MATEKGIQSLTFGTEVQSANHYITAPPLGFLHLWVICSFKTSLFYVRLMLSIKRTNQLTRYEHSNKISMSLQLLQNLSG